MTRIPVRSYLRSLLLAAACGFGLVATLPVQAQVAPSAAEVARYTDLHAAAYSGDLAKLEKLIAARADRNARDAYGRTPLHVATFARQRDAIRMLAKAAAALDVLENDRYDAVTIAAVADEETLRVLLSLGASAKQVTSRYDGTALIAAAHLGHDGVVKQLIAAGAPLDRVNNLHWTAVIESIVLGNGVGRATSRRSAHWWQPVRPHSSLTGRASRHWHWHGRVATERWWRSCRRQAWPVEAPAPGVRCLVATQDAPARCLTGRPRCSRSGR